MLKTNAYILEKSEIEDLFLNTHVSGINISVMGNVTLEYTHSNLTWVQYDFYNILNLSNENVDMISSLTIMGDDIVNFFINWEVVLELINRKHNTTIEPNQIEILIYDEKKNLYTVIVTE